MREDEYTEFKKTTGELNAAIISIGSILNKNGRGKVYFGLKNDGTVNKFEISDSTLRDVSRKIFEGIKPQIFPVIEKKIFDGVDVIVVEFEGQDKPYSAFGKYYIRVADEDRELTPQELRKMMINKEYEDNWGNRSSNETLLDVDDTTIDKFYLDATECGRLPDIAKNKKEILLKLGLLNGDKLTNAGKCLFSKNSPIVLKMAVFAGEHKTTFLDINRVEGNVFQLIDIAINYLVRNIRWRVQLSGDGIHREEIPEVPVAVLREAVVNSFAHAKYDVNVQHEIDIYSNRITIINPGCFANEFTPIDFTSRDIHSYLRNESIARTLYLCKDVEAFGSGLRKIYSLCEADGVKIFYENHENDFMIGFTRRDANLDNDDKPKNNKSLDEREIKIMESIKENPYITNDELGKRFNVTSRTIARSISNLKNKDLIRRVGPTKGGYWKIY